jgi:hypothetical protein
MELTPSTNERTQTTKMLPTRACTSTTSNDEDAANEGAQEQEDDNSDGDAANKGAHDDGRDDNNDKDAANEGAQEHEDNNADGTNGDGDVRPYNVRQDFLTKESTTHTAASPTIRPRS